MTGGAGDGRALEFAIGTGRIGLPLHRRGVEVHGIELSRAMLEHLAEEVISITNENVAAAAAVADLDPPQTSLNGRTYNGERISQAYGSTLPGPIWREAMNEALEDEPEEDFKDP